MSATKDRINQIVANTLDLDHEPDFNAQLGESEINSMEAVAFFKLVDKEFGLGMAIEDFSKFQTLQDLVEHIDARG
ncbi:MAG: acyl carrier protein [Nitrospinae bacterium]|nr:acyl carrier protein [Nitrospinota bacterium]